MRSGTELSQFLKQSLPSLRICAVDRSGTTQKWLPTENLVVRIKNAKFVTRSGKQENGRPHGLSR